MVAAGSGSRFGSERPKQYELLGERRVLDWSLAHAREASDGIVLVVAEAYLNQPEPGADVVVVGGETRSDSVRAGLAAVPDDAEIVVVHDAARPLADQQLFDTVIEAVLAGADGAVPALAVTDTIKRVDDQGRVLETLERDELVAVQTPQAFRAEVLRRAHDEPIEATDDAMLVEDDGGVVVAVPGDPRNLKITVLDDLERLLPHFG